MLDRDLLQSRGTGSTTHLGPILSLPKFFTNLHGVVCRLKCNKVIHYLVFQPLASWAPTKLDSEIASPHTVHGYIAITKRLSFEFTGIDTLDVLGFMNSLWNLNLDEFFKIRQDLWHVNKASTFSTVKPPTDIETATMRAFYWVVKVPLAIHEDRSGRLGNIDVVIYFTFTRMDKIVPERCGKGLQHLAWSTCTSRVCHLDIH